MLIHRCVFVSSWHILPVPLTPRVARSATYAFDWNLFFYDDVPAVPMTTCTDKFLEDTLPDIPAMLQFGLVIDLSGSCM